jgi:predicted acylesterase/phospholipase RssA
MKTVVVLSGGGAKGSMQFGFLKYLCEQGLNPDVIYGTSTGALNSAGYTYLGIEKLEDVWKSITKKSDVFKFNWKTLLFMSQGVFNARPLKKLLEKHLIGTPQIDAYACKVSLISGEVAYSKSGDNDFIESVLASSCVPGLVEPVNNEWVDEGLREQTPLKKAIKDGADKIIVVLCNPWKENPDEDKVGNWVKNIIRTTDIMSHEIFLNDVENCLWYNEHPELGKKYIELEVYAPEKIVINTDEFSQEKIHNAIAYGYEQAKKGPVIKSGR